MIRRSLALAFAFTAVTFTGTALLQARDQGQAATPEQIEKGMKVYEAQKCQLCHSINGKGNPKGPLDSVGLKLSAEEIHAWLVNPKEMATKTKATRTPMMRAYGNLPKEDLDALVAYMKSLQKK